MIEPKTIARRLAVAGLISRLAMPAAAQRPEVPLEPCRAGPGATADPAGPIAELVRLREIEGAIPALSRGLRRGSDAVEPACPPDGGLSFHGLQAGAAPARVSAWENSGYAVDRNNGAIWTGRGVSTAFEAGVWLRAGPVTAALAPVVGWSQNADFRIRPVARAGFSPWVYPYGGSIDLPQRFGGDAFVFADWGQSYVRADVGPVGTGFSTENLWVGPGIRNSILMSNTAGGFPHLFAGTGHPTDIWIGRLDFDVVWGWLHESDYFDANPANDRNGLVLWAFDFEPRPLPGLHLGAARAYMFADSASGIDPLLDILALGSSTNLAGNELFSIFARWVLPSADAEIYGEWARDDRYAGLTTDFLLEPDHSQAYTIGMQKLTPVGDAALRVQAELTALQEKGEDRSGSRPLPVYYTNSEIRQGYTHHGQLLGAGIGPGSDAEFVGIDWVDGWGYGGVFVERVRRNDASAAALAARRYWPYDHDTELTGGVRGLLRRGPWLGVASLAYSRRYNRDFLEDDDNVALSLSLTWVP